ncbi:MAG: hypothetical protein KAJ58_00940 [Candidatus Pacebacteria bacterium]|nr:hypothetical protein [Candidatus Paceibacterota bacterium]
MNKKKILIAAILVIIIPLVGIPVLWKTWLLVAAGLYIIWQTFASKDKDKDIEEEKEKNFDKVYIENEKNIEE